MERRAILIVAGEVSGDMHAANLVTALKHWIPATDFAGIGGPAMRDAGVETIYDIEQMDVMGFSEVLRRYPFFKKVFDDIVEWARINKPRAVILVDYPGFNLRLAKVLKATGVEVFYYICPQVWAWNRQRIPRMAKIVDHLLTIFPFEPELFNGTGLHATFVGHPLVDEAEAAMKATPIELPWQGEQRIAVLPGSRPHEVRRILPPMWDAAGILEDKHPRSSFIIAAPSLQIERIVRRTIGSLPPGPDHWSIVTGHTRQVLRQASAAMVASGTATIEAALMQCPMVITYRTSALTYALGRMLVKVDQIGMVNIVAGQEVCPELIQSMATGSNIANALMPYLADTPKRRKIKEGLSNVKALLGSGHAAQNAARLIAEALQAT